MSRLTTEHSALLSQDVRPDRKQRCPGCGELRSFTLITAAGDCALCVAQLDEPVPETLPLDRSCWWVQQLTSNLTLSGKPDPYLYRDPGP